MLLPTYVPMDMHDRDLERRLPSLGACFRHSPNILRLSYFQGNNESMAALFARRSSATSRVQNLIYLRRVLLTRFHQTSPPAPYHEETHAMMVPQHANAFILQPLTI